MMLAHDYVDKALLFNTCIDHCN